MTKSYNNILTLIIFVLLGLYVSLRSESELSNEQKLRAQLFTLKAQLTQCQVSMSNESLKTEQNNLLNEFKSTLNPNEQSEFDWNSLKFVESKDKK